MTERKSKPLNQNELKRLRGGGPRKAEKTSMTRQYGVENNYKKNVSKLTFQDVTETKLVIRFLP
jgi:hypothetical protein